MLKSELLGSSVGEKPPSELERGDEAAFSDRTGGERGIDRERRTKVLHPSRGWEYPDRVGMAKTEIPVYHKYVGHDNNRDWYSFSQAETRLTVEKVHNVWWPQITYDVHQMGGTGARMFVPPWTDPVDPNIDPLIVQQVNKMGTAMAVDLTTAGKKGVLINGIYDYFTPARHYPSYHGGLRLLSEAASVRYASPVNVPFSSLKSNGRGYNAQQASWNFLEPWAGGRWTLRDIIDYQLITFESCLYNAALQREDLLRNFYRIGRRVIKRHKDLAYVIPRQQHDPSAMTGLLRTLAFGAVEIERAIDGFRADGRVFQSGDYVIRLAQPYGAFAKTLLEKQNYPDLRQYPGGHASSAKGAARATPPHAPRKLAQSRSDHDSPRARRSSGP